MTAQSTQQTLEAPERPPFRPEMHLSNVGSATYLEVKWRLVWFRDEHPNGLIETELVEHKVSSQQPDLSFAVFKATVQTSDGAGATGYGSESREDFKDYLEKAETRALGRALAALGYGTQFTADFETGGRLVDNPAPDSKISLARSHSTGGNGHGSNGYSAQDNGELATPKQVSFCRSLIKDAGLTANWLATTLADDFNGTKDLAELTKREISQLIDGLKSGRFNQEQASEQADAGSTPSADDPFGELPW